MGRSSRAANYLPRIAGRPLTLTLGHQRGAEELTRPLDAVFGTLIAEAHTEYKAAFPRRWSCDRRMVLLSMATTWPAVSTFTDCTHSRKQR